MGIQQTSSGGSRAKTGALVLAAGNATRFGGAKQLLEIDGETLVDRACRIALASGCRPVLRVLGARAEEIRILPEMPEVGTWVHEDWAAGMGGSLAAGIRRLLEIEPECDSIFVLLADQPLVSPGLLRKMLEFPATMVLCDYGEATGPPALFRRPHFPDLMALAGDRGAKSLAAKHPDAVAWMPFPGGACDIDSREAWENFMLSRENDGRHPL